MPRIICLLAFSLVLLPHTSVLADELVLYALDRNTADVEWSPDGSRIAYAKADPDGDGYMDIWVVSPDATGHTRLNKGWNLEAGFPHRHVGCVTWHPSGEWIVFVAQNNDATGERLDEIALPGSGINCNLWAMSGDGSRVWQLTHHKTSLSKPRGVIHPQFSRDGTRLVWAEALGKYPRKDLDVNQWGKWAVRLADFKIGTDGPRLANRRRYKPGPQKVFYETHDFSPDDDKVLLCANSRKGQPLNGIDIYQLDLATGKAKRLTRTRTDWDEHAHYSPDGSLIAWASGNGFDVEFPTLRSPEWKQYVKLDLWVMRAGGSDKMRLTYFNEEGHPDNDWFSETIYDSPRLVTSDSSWSPDGNHLVLTVAFEGPDGARGSYLLMLDVDTRLRELGLR